MKITGNLLFITVLSFSGLEVLAETYDAIIGFSPRVELSLPVSGMVDRVKVSVGQHVKKGETMITLDDAPFKAERLLRQSHVALQKVRLDEAKRDLKFQQELYDRTVLSTVELENAQLRVKRDSSLLASAKAKLAMADYVLSYSQLKAPFDAIIVDVQINEGQAINNALQSQSLVSLVRKGYYVAGFKITAELLGKLAVDSPVEVVIGDTRYPAKISAIAYEPLFPGKSKDVDEERRFHTEAVFSTESDSILAGKKAMVKIE